MADYGQARQRYRDPQDRMVRSSNFLYVRNGEARELDLTGVPSGTDLDSVPTVQQQAKARAERRRQRRQARRERGQ